MVWAPEAFENIYEVGSDGGGASNIPQSKALVLAYLFQVVSRLVTQVRVTIISIKLCITTALDY